MKLAKIKLNQTLMIKFKKILSLKGFFTDLEEVKIRNSKPTMITIKTNMHIEAEVKPTKAIINKENMKMENHTRVTDIEGEDNIIIKEGTAIEMTIKEDKSLTVKINNRTSSIK
jgi:hypothetical protein